MTKKHVVTLDTLADELDQARSLALASAQAGAAVQATTVKAKLFGHLVDRKEVGKPGEFNGMESAQDVLDQVRKELGEQAAQALAAALQAAGDAAPAESDPPPEPTHDAPGGMN